MSSWNARAPGRGGTEKAKAVLGIMHETQEPACQASSWVKNGWGQGEAVSPPLCCQSQALGWPVSLFCSSHIMISYKRLMSISLTVFITRNCVPGKWAATLLFIPAKSSEQMPVEAFWKSSLINIWVFRTQVCQPPLTLHSPSDAGEQTANPTARFSPYLLARGPVARVTFSLSALDYSGHAQVWQHWNCVPAWGQLAEKEKQLGLWSGMLNAPSIFLISALRLLLPLPF